MTNTIKNAFRVCFAAILAFALSLMLASSAWAANGYSFDFNGTSSNTSSGAAPTAPSATSYADYFIFDMNGTLDISTTKDLQNKCAAAAQKTNIGVYVMFVDKLNTSDVESYCKQVYSQLGLGVGSKKSGMLLLVATESRDYGIKGFGTALDAYCNDYIDELDNTVVSNLKANNWSGAAQQFVDMSIFGAEYYAERGEYYVPEKEPGNPIPGVFIGVVVAIIVARGMANGKKKAHLSAQEAFQADHYLQEGSLQLTDSHDEYLRTDVVVIARHNDNKGGSGGGLGGGSFGSSGGFRGGKF